MSKWKKKEFHKIIEYIIGGDWGKEEQDSIHNEKVNIIRGTDFKDWDTNRANNSTIRFIKKTSLDSRELKLGDLVIEVSGGGPTQPVGRSVFIDNKTIQQINNPMICSNFFRLVRIKKDECLPAFINLYLMYIYNTGQINNFQTQTTNLRNLNMKKFMNELLITFPEDQDEQKEIVDILDKAQEMVRLRKKAVELTEEMIPSIFYEMFGDPVKNEKGWDVEPLNKLVSHVSSGSTPRGGQSVYLKTGITFIRSQNVLMNQLDLSDVVFIDNKTHDSMNRSKVKNNDVLFNITGASIARTAYYNGEDDSANVNQHVCIIRTKPEELNHIFLSYLITSPNYQSMLMSKQSGATRQAFNYQQIRMFEIIKPSIKLQNNFAEITKHFDELKTEQIKAIQLAEEQFRALLQAAFEGKLTAHKYGNK